MKKKCGPTCTCRTDGYRKTPLMHAACVGSMPIAKLLLKRKKCALVNAIDCRGMTALLFAVQENAEDVVRLLLAAGADCNAANGDGCTALIYAVRNKNVSVSRALLDANADVNVKDKDGRTALARAVEANNTALAVTFMEHGADTNVTGLVVYDRLEGLSASTQALFRGGIASVHAIAAAHGSMDIVQRLLASGGYQTLFNGRQQSMYHAAVYGGNIDVLRAVHAHGTEQLGNGFLALMVAVARQRTEMVEFLLKNGASVDANHEGDAPIFGALRCKDSGMVSLLLSHGASTNVLNKEGESPLLLVHAIYPDKVPHVWQTIARQMLEAMNTASPDVVNAQSSHEKLCGRTALAHAASTGAVGMVRKLLSCGADSTIVCRQGMTPLHLATVAGAVAVVKILVTHKVANNPIQTPSRKRKRKNSAASNPVDELYPGCNIDATDVTGFTALMCAVVLTNKRMIAVLLDHGASIHACSGLAVDTVRHVNADF